MEKFLWLMEGGRFIVLLMQHKHLRFFFFFFFFEDVMESLQIRQNIGNFHINIINISFELRFSFNETALMSLTLIKKF